MRGRRNGAMIDVVTTQPRRTRPAGSRDSGGDRSGDPVPLVAGRQGASALTRKEREYLEVIYYLAARGEPVIAARLAEWLKVKPPTVTQMLQRLVRKGAIRRAEGGPVALTETGYEQAEAIVRRHRLLECFLVDIMGMPWHAIHEEAVRLEHGMSPLMVERMEALVGASLTCPHGNPVPGNRETYPGSVRLDQASVGQSFQLRRIVEEAEEDNELMRYLQAHGLVPGAACRIADASPRFGVVLEHEGHSVAVSSAVAGVLWGDLGPGE